MELSPQIEDYLKGIYMLQTRDRQVSTTALAGRLGITAPSSPDRNFRGIFRFISIRFFFCINKMIQSCPAAASQV